ncbi:MAG: helix-turn-helix transcriptional regulator [Clostridia bacterium]|nr:helix-turn-helix transcriptional regulator [Clostridia bacterium]
MQSNEKFRGQTDGIILYVLSKGSRHAEELKVIIDKYFSGVKIGTLYSIITRLKNQRLISEYRASSIDGSRRKYYNLTEKGSETFFDKYSALFNDVEFIFDEADYTVISDKNQDNSDENLESTYEKDNIIVEDQNSVDFNVDSNNKKENEYFNMINSSVTSEDAQYEIDFSTLTEEESVKNEVSTPIKEESSFIPYDTDYPLVKDEEIPYESDSVLNNNVEYKSILSKLYPKKSSVKTENVDENDISDTVIVEEFSENSTDWSEVYDLAEKEGIKIRTSSDTNRYQGSKILLTKLLMFSSFITLAFTLFSYLVLTLSIKGVEFSGGTFGLISLFLGFVSLVLTFAYILNPQLKVKNLPKFINSLEIALVITISTAIISLSIAFIRGIDLANLSELFNSVILPIVMSISIPVFTIITYLLSKTEHFESL